MTGDSVKVIGTLMLFPNFLSRCDLTCHSHRDDSIRDWQWLGLDGITQDNGHGQADGMPTLGICTVEAVGQPLPIALFVRQSFGSLDVLINKGLL